MEFTYSSVRKIGFLGIRLLNTLNVQEEGVLSVEWKNFSGIVGNLMDRSHRTGLNKSFVHHFPSVVDFGHRNW